MSDDDRDFYMSLDQRIDTLTKELENVTEFLEHVDPSEQGSTAYLSDLKGRLENSLNALNDYRLSESSEEDSETDVSN